MKYRDPETGEFKELYTKAADTLPVGTIVDYDGDEIPAGWEAAESDDYSLEEIFTGKYWVNGKKIYRKVIDLGALPNANGQYYNNGISNLATVTAFDAFAQHSSGTTITLPYATSYQLERNISIEIEPTRFYIYTGIDRSDLNGYVILEYTKIKE